MLFVIDFDGTLSIEDSIDAMLVKFADPMWEVVEKDWLDGKITAVECLKKQVQMVCADKTTLDTFFQAIQIDETFFSLYNHIKAFAKVVLISDGLDYVVQSALQNFYELKMMPIYSNKMHFIQQGIDISYPYLSPSCKGGNGVCKCKISRELSARDSEDKRIVLVGDGKSDFCLAQEADIVFAKGKLARFCEDNALPFFPFNQFCDVLAIVQQWRKT